MYNLGVKMNNLKKIRTELGFTITALSTLANISTTVISRTERMIVNPTLVTKNKIINGLNAEESSTGKKWEYKDIFPFHHTEFGCGIYLIFARKVPG